MRDIAVLLILLASTIALIGLVRLLTSLLSPDKKRIKAEVRVYFDDSDSCLEYTLGRMYSASAFKNADLHVAVVDCVDTDESRQWLEALKRKLRRDFDIVKEGENNGRLQSGDNKRHG